MKAVGDLKKTELVLKAVRCPLTHRIHKAVLCGFGRFILLWFWQEMLYEAARTVEKTEGAHKLQSDQQDSSTVPVTKWDLKHVSSFQNNF